MRHSESPNQSEAQSWKFLSVKIKVWGHKLGLKLQNLENRRERKSENRKSELINIKTNFNELVKKEYINNLIH